MEKIKEIKFHDESIKYYYTEDRLSIFDIISRLKSNNIIINSIEIEEDVEGDMKTISGAVYSESEFENQFSYIVTHMRNGSFEISATFNEKPIEITIFSTKPYYVLSTLDENLEIDSLLLEKGNS